MRAGNGSGWNDFSFGAMIHEASFFEFHADALSSLHFAGIMEENFVQPQFRGGGKSFVDFVDQVFVGLFG